MSLIFKDREKLSPRYVPEVLPHREKQIEILFNFFKDALNRPSQTFLRTIQIIGSVGSGKTCSAIRFGERFEREAQRRRLSVKHVYVNLKLHGGGKVPLYRHLVQQAAPEVFSQSLGAEELLYNMIGFLKENKRNILVILDEVDYFIRHAKDSSVVYELTRLNELTRPAEPCGVVGIIFTARSRDFYSILSEAEISSLGRFPLEFKPYVSNQIYDILSQRVKEAFQPNALSTDILEYVSDITSNPPVNGDTRYALDLLLYSGNLAEFDGSDKILPEHLRHVINQTHPSITTEDVLSLPPEARLTLLGVVRALKSHVKLYTSLKEIREMCSVVCEEYGVKPLSGNAVEEALDDLHDRGMVNIKSLSSIGITGVPTEALEKFLDDLINKVRRGFEYNSS